MSIIESRKALFTLAVLLVHTTAFANIDELLPDGYVGGQELFAFTPDVHNQERGFFVPVPVQYDDPTHMVLKSEFEDHRGNMMPTPHPIPAGFLREALDGSFRPMAPCQLILGSYQATVIRRTTAPRGQFRGGA